MTGVSYRVIRPGFELTVYLEALERRHFQLLNQPGTPYLGRNPETLEELESEIVRVQALYDESIGALDDSR